MKHILIFLLISLCTAANYQWRLSPSQGIPITFFTHDTEVFVCVEGGANGYPADYRFIPRYDTNINFDTSLPASGMSCFASAGSYLFAGGPGIYRSSNEGSSWTFLKSTMFLGGESALGSIDTVLLMNNGAMYRSTDYGNTWIQGIVGQAYCFANYDDTEFASGSDFWHSTDSGDQWILNGNGGVATMAIIGNYIFGGGTYGGAPGSTALLCSSDRGKTWTNLNQAGVFPGGGITGVTSFGTNVFVGTDGAGVYVSTDLGNTWMARNDGLPKLDVTAVGVCDSFVVIGLRDDGDNSGWGVWFRPVSQMVGNSAVQQATSSGLETLSIYPNPMGSNCTIAFSLLNEGPVNITVLDAMGRVLAMPFSGNLEPGEHTVPLEAGNLPSGTYWCQLTTEGKQRMAKVTILK